MRVRPESIPGQKLAGPNLQALAERDARRDPRSAVHLQPNKPPKLQ